MTSLFLMAYVTILVAELVGDKSLYTVGTLVTRFRTFPMFCGICLAFVGKMLAAVLLGSTIAALPMTFVNGLTSCIFFLMAFVIWRKKSVNETIQQDHSTSWLRTTLISFSTLFFTEWADAGQITASMLVARYHSPLIIWASGTLALITKSILAMMLGRGLQKHISQQSLRYLTLWLYFAMGMLAAFGVDP